MRPIVLTATATGRLMARMDEWAPGPISIQVVIAGGTGATYSIQVSNDDPNSATNPVPAGSMTWSPSPDGAAANATTNLYTTLAQVPLWVSLNVTALSAASVTATIVQASSVPY